MSEMSFCENEFAKFVNNRVLEKIPPNIIGVWVFESWIHI